jgi:hypothetical protein
MRTATSWKALEDKIARVVKQARGPLAVSFRDSEPEEVKKCRNGHFDSSCRVCAKHQKSTGIWIPGAQRSSRRARAVPPLPGPVYVHARDCERHNGGGAFPQEYRGRLLTLDAYGEDRALVTEVRVSGGDEEKVAETLFEDPEVKYIHVRSTEAGC